MFLFLFPLLVCSACAFAPASKLKPDGRIVGGLPADISEHPYQVAVLFDEFLNDRFIHTCGGTIISARSILTAAQCVNGTVAKQWMVRTGSNFHNFTGTLTPVSYFYVHPNFNSNLDCDVAVLRLIAPLVFSSNTAPVVMASQGQTAGDGDMGTITGWGIMNEGGLKPSILMAVKVPVVNRDTCRAVYSTINAVTSNMICAGFAEGNRDACLGDEGGPMVVNGFLFGVTSWGMGCGRPEFPGVYANIGDLRWWIDDNM